MHRVSATVFINWSRVTEVVDHPKEDRVVVHFTSGSYSVYTGDDRKALLKAVIEQAELTRLHNLRLNQ